MRHLKALSGYIAIVGLMAASVAQQAHATLPTGFDTAVATYQTDAVEALGLLMAAGIVIWGLKKLMSKLGLG
ncbi:MAG: hypothetical protein KF740_19440 [Ramlibacter sp.]|nr:hypothetical protein [Ramlibacter sp.]